MDKLIGTQSAQDATWEIHFTSQKESRKGAHVTDRRPSAAEAIGVFRIMRDAKCYRDLYMVCPDGSIVRG